LDYVAGKEPARGFYKSHDPVDVAQAVDRASFARAQLVDILTRQNRQYQSDEKTFASITTLSQPDTLCVFSGQQAGLFTGPLLVLVKALALIKIARAYSQQLGRPILPVFWIAGDDHDFDEVAGTWALNQQSELVDIRYGAKPDKEYPAAEISLSDGIELDRVKQLFRDSLGQTEFTPRLYELLNAAYTPDDTFVSAFGKLLAGLTAGTGLVLFNPCDGEVKELATSFFEQLIDRQEEIHETLTASNRAIEQAGYHLQVAKKDTSAHLFRNLNGRRPIHFEAGGFNYDGAPLTAGEVKAQVGSHPEQFSPDVMTRPLMQSFLFPVLCQLGGPAEIAYLAQSNALFGLFDLPTPIHRPRPTLSLLEKRIERLMDDYHLTFDDLMGDIEQPINRILTASFPKDLERGYADLTSRIKADWQGFAESSLKFDPSLEEIAKQTVGKIDFALKGFEGKLFSAHKKKSKETRERIYRAQRHLFPNRGLQERTINIGCYLARHGFDVVSFMLEEMDVEQTAHQVLPLSEMAD
jgi:bacillithiol biosynthesis cysteine-adding enzyme BshC